MAQAIVFLVISRVARSVRAGATTPAPRPSRSAHSVSRATSRSRSNTPPNCAVCARSKAGVSIVLLERMYGEGQPVKASELLFQHRSAPFRAEANAREPSRRATSLFVRRAAAGSILPLFGQTREPARPTPPRRSKGTANVAAALRSAELILSYTDVRAPIAGLTSREVRSEGSLVTAGDDTSLLAYLVQSDRLYIELALPEADAALVRAAHAVRPDAVVVRVVDTRGAQIGPDARIEFIAPRVDDATALACAPCSTTPRTHCYRAAICARDRRRAWQAP
jgi:hypothetical protein